LKGGIGYQLKKKGPVCDGMIQLFAQGAMQTSSSHTHQLVISTEGKL